MDRKSIAVPTRDSSRARRSSVSSVPVVPDIPETGPQAHRYNIGERLQLRGAGIHWGRYDGTCVVIALLPLEGNGTLAYRVRNEREQFERVVSENDLGRR